MKKFLTALIACACVCSQAAPVTIMGAASCTDWVKDAKSKAPIKLSHDMIGMWVLGYVSAANIHAGADFLVGRDAKGLIKWVDEYCSAHPLDNSRRAADELIKTLQAQ